MSEQAKDIHDLSERVISLAREIDRLPAGTYSVHVVKPDLAALSWHVEISRMEPIREMELAKREIRIAG